ncbi:MAG: SPOR domain-containing protein, partial [Bacteroidota bacterium]|nr:SPOR domain-containing protein [Bacteroidota bacterium]
STAQRVSSLFARYSPRSTADCRLHAVSFGTFRYLKNAHDLIDTLKEVLDCPLFVRQTADPRSGETRYSVRTGMFRDRSEADEMVARYQARLRKSKITLPIRVVQETIPKEKRSD